MMPVPSTIHVVLADDHELVRAGIRSLLSGLKGIEVLAEVSDGQELLELLETVHPDVVVTDINMPGMDGIAAVRRIRQLYPALRVIMLTMNDSPEAIRAAVDSGANGYVRKDAPEFELEMALRTVVSTGSYFDSGVAQRLLAPAEPRPEQLLTERQLQVLVMLAQGRSAKEIGFELGLSSKTVDVHRAKIMERLELNDVASLTLYAVRKGLVKP